MYKEELKNIDTPDKAYLLGLMYSDGNISNKTYLSRIQLKIDDSEILYKIKNIFPFFKVYLNDKSITIYCSSKKLYEHFKFNGLVERKSLNNRDLLQFPNLNEELKFDFIRGYIDGNGSININTYKNKTDKKVYIYSVNIDFLNSIRNTFLQYEIKSSFIIDTRISNFTKKEYTLYSLSVKPSNLKVLYDLLYKENSLYMKRKKDKFDLIYNSNFFIAANCPNCKFCNGKLVKNGKDKFYNCQRYLCKKCNKTLLESALSNSNITIESDELLES